VRSASALLVIVCLCGFACSSKQNAHKPEPVGPAPVEPVEPAPVKPVEPARPATAAELLERTSAKYQSLRTYRDQGRCMNKFMVAGTEFIDTKPFETAYERGGRVKFTFKHSRGPGMPAEMFYGIWSPDGKKFDWARTSRKLKDSGVDAKTAFLRPTQVSGAATTFVLPMLIEGTDLPLLLALESAEFLADDTFDGQACRVVKGVQKDGAVVTVWIDGALAVRRAVIERVVEMRAAPSADPNAPKTNKTTVVTTIVADRVQFDAVIPDWAFAPPTDAELFPQIGEPDR